MAVTRVFGRFAAIAAIVLFCVDCQAVRKDNPKKNPCSEVSSECSSVLGDSISDILFEARKITCRLVGKAPGDTLRRDTVRVVPARLVPVAQYLLADPYNFKTDNIVYGEFHAWASLEFDGRKKRRVRLELDFGLAKWRLLDAGGKQLCRRDMAANRRQFIRLVRTMFPDDLTLKMLNDNLNTKK